MKPDPPILQGLRGCREALNMLVHHDRDQDSRDRANRQEMRLVCRTMALC